MPTYEVRTVTNEFIGQYRAESATSAIQKVWEEHGAPYPEELTADKINVVKT